MIRAITFINTDAVGLNQEKQLIYVVYYQQNGEVSARGDEGVNRESIGPQIALESMSIL
jgi:hypothetical protein